MSQQSVFEWKTEGLPKLNTKSANNKLLYSVRVLLVMQEGESYYFGSYSYKMKDWFIEKKVRDKVIKVARWAYIPTHLNTD